MDVREKSSNEKRLIDYDETRRLFDAQYKETVRLIRDGETHLDNLAEGFTEADRIIQKIPAVDAVEVVRCIDCKHFHTETVEEQTPYGFTNDKKVCGCMLRGEWVDVFIDDFCSYGERKEK